MASKATETFSALTDHDVRELRADYRIPSARVRLFVPGKYQAICDHDSKRIAIYEEMLKIGVRFPFEGLEGQFLRAFQIAPAQMTPNSWRIVRQLGLWARGAGVALTGNSLLRVLTIKWSGDFLAVQRAGNAKIVEGMPSSNKGWKPRFFFARLLDRDGEPRVWDVPVKWRDNIMLRDSEPLTPAEELALKALGEALPLQYTPMTSAPMGEPRAGAKRPREAKSSAESPSKETGKAKGTAQRRTAEAKEAAQRKTVEAKEAAQRKTVEAKEAIRPTRLEEAEEEVVLLRKKTVARKRQRLIKSAEAKGPFLEEETREAVELSAQEGGQKEAEDLRVAVQASLAETSPPVGAPLEESSSGVEMFEAGGAEESSGEMVDDSSLKYWVSEDPMTFLEERAHMTTIVSSEDAEAFFAKRTEAESAEARDNEVAEAFLRAVAEDVLFGTSEVVCSEDAAPEDEVVEDAANAGAVDAAAPAAEASTEDAATAEAVDATIFAAEATTEDVATAEAMDAASPAAEATMEEAATAEAMDAASPAAEATIKDAATAEAMDVATPAAEAIMEDAATAEAMDAAASAAEAIMEEDAAAGATEAVDTAAEAAVEEATTAGTKEAATPVAEASEPPAEPCSLEPKRIAPSRQELIERLKAARKAGAGQATLLEAVSQIPVGQAEGETTPGSTTEEARPAAGAGAVPALSSGGNSRGSSLLEGLAVGFLGEAREAVSSVLALPVEKLFQQVVERLRVANQAAFEEGRNSGEQLWSSRAKELETLLEQSREEARKAKALALEATQERDSRKDEAEKAEARAAEAEARVAEAEERATELQRENDHMAQHAALEAEQAVQNKVDLLEQKVQEAEALAHRAESSLGEARAVISVLRGQYKEAETRAYSLGKEASISAEAADKSQREVKRLLGRLGKLETEANSLRAGAERLEIAEMSVESLKRQLTESKAETVAANLREAENSAVYYNTAVEDIQRKHKHMDFSEFLIRSAED